MASFLHQHRKRAALTPATSLEPRLPESDVSDQRVLQQSPASETGGRSHSIPDPSSHTLSHHFDAIGILPSDPASLAAPHIVPTQAHVTLRPVQPQWLGPGAVSVQRQNHAAAPVMEPRPEEAVLPGEMDMPPANLPPAAEVERRPTNENVPEPEPAEEEEPPLEPEHQEGEEPALDPNAVAGQVAAGVGQVVPANMPNAGALVLANAVANAPGAAAEEGAGPGAANPPRRPGLLSRIGQRISAAGEWLGSRASAAGSWLGSRASAAGSWLGSRVGALGEALGEQVRQLDEWLTKQGPANVAKLFGGTVAPVAVSVGGLLSNAGVRIAHMLEPARNLVSAAGHVLNPVGLAFTVMSFILNVRSAFTSHQHFKNLERLAKEVLAADGHEEVDPNLTLAMHFAAGQKERKRNIKVLSSVGGAFGVSGGTIATLAVFGVALSAAVPWVGLALAIVGGVTAGGILLYRMYRKRQKEAGTKLPKFGLTREQAARIIYEAAKRVQDNTPASFTEFEVVRMALKELKLDLSVAAGPIGYDQIMRKLKS